MVGRSPPDYTASQAIALLGRAAVVFVDHETLIK